MEKSIKCFCAKCKQQTNHRVLAEHLERGNDDEYFFRQTYRMVMCRGCEQVSFDMETTEEANIQYDQDGREEMYSVHASYPVKEGELMPISTPWTFPRPVLKVYGETVKAINVGCFTLASAGFRAVIESICLDKGVSGRTLEAKINNMQKAGIITLADRDRFHAVRFLGNDSVHEIKTPERSTLLVVLEIIEGILKNLYVFDEKISLELDKPIRTIDEFVVLLEEGLVGKTAGTINVLRNLLSENRRLISEDLARFEQDLIELINSGKFKKLSLCPPPGRGRHQRYKVEPF